MPTPSSLFPPVPNDTVRAAEAVPVQCIYRTIGDRVEQLLTGIEIVHLDPSGLRSASTLVVLALATVFQFAENVPDRRAAEATRTRPDWKYALHLAPTHPGIDHCLLCEFRRTLWRDPASRQIFQQVLDRLAGTDLLSGMDRRPITAAEVLAVVCRVSRLEELIEVMRMVLEAVAAFEPEALRTIMLPHWYERYSQMQAARVLPKSEEEQVSLAQALGADATYLLEAIARTGDALSSLPETRALQRVWARQFESADSPLQWHTPVCVACFLF